MSDQQNTPRTGHPGHERMLAVMLDRVTAGEPLDDVLADYGYTRAQPPEVDAAVRHGEQLQAEAEAERDAARAEVEGLRRAIGSWKREEEDWHKEMGELRAMCAGSERRCATAEIERDELRAKLAKAKEALKAIRLLAERKPDNDATACDVYEIADEALDDE